MSLNAVIIDDEVDSRQILRTYIKKYCVGVNIVGEAESAITGFEAIKHFMPDVVFLDISMPLEDGFDFLQKFIEPTFDVIFVTAFDSYAIKAIKCSAVDYLLKPLDIEQLQEAIQKVRKRREEKSMYNNIQLLKDSLQKRKISKIALPTNEGFVYLDIKEIIRLESDGNYTWFYMNNKEKLLITKTLKEYEPLLEEHNFIRVHHAHLINTDFIRSYHREGTITMADNTQIEVSTRKRSEVLAKLKH
jgi:two-component system LytT family response regulator